MKPLYILVISFILSTNNAYAATISVEMDFFPTLTPGWSGNFTYDPNSAESIVIGRDAGLTRFDLVDFQVSGLGHIFSNADTNWSGHVLGDEVGNVGLFGLFFDDDSGERLTAVSNFVTHISVLSGAGERTFLSLVSVGTSPPLRPFYGTARYTSRPLRSGSQVPEPTAALLFAIGFAIIGRTMKVRRIRI